MKIDELGLSARAYHVLKEARIDTVEQLREALSNPFVKIGSISSSVFNELQEKIAAHPLTNADRIRAMSDEKLAYWMTHLHEDGHCLNERCQIFQDKTCEECVIDWLKQPAKEET